METTNNKSYGYGKRPLWQWLLLYAVIGVVAYAGIYYFFFAKKGSSLYGDAGISPTPARTVTETSPTATPQPSEAPIIPQTQSTVILNADGFSPATLTIKPGTTVTWENKSGSGATVNSDPHPTHTAYPPLNLGPFNDGDSLKLTFDQPGTYGYHNHLNPSQKGKIIVQ